MTQPPAFTFLPDPRMPLRDALRGVATIADATEDALEPATRLLPGGLRSRFRSALKSIGDAGKGLLSAPIDPAHLRAASEFVRGTRHDHQLAADCAMVIGHAWDHLPVVGPGHRHLISETILASTLRHLGPGAVESPARRAAHIVQSLRQHAVAGPMPGIGSRRGAGGETDIALVAIIVWLLSDRAGGLAEEERLLDLSLALVLALEAEILGAIDDPVRLAPLLQSASEHL